MRDSDIGGRSEPRHLGTNYFVDRAGLEQAIMRLISMPGEEKAAIGNRARARFLAIDQGFRQRAGEIFGVA